MTKYGNMMLEFIKKEIFEERKNISVEEVVTLVAALNVFKHMVGKIGFDVGQLGKSSLYA